MNPPEVYRYIDAHYQDFIEDLVRLIGQPSVSAKGEGIQECVEMVEKLMREVGLSTRIIPEKDGNPVLYGEIRSETSGKTLLFYNHYDVQPPEPLDEWSSDPFSCEIRDGRIFGRGTADNKGNIVSRLNVVRAYLKTVGSVPINLKFVVDGEEEVGSPNLPAVIKEHKELFSADAGIWEFGNTDRKGCPIVYLGLKGVLSVELRAQGANRDVHSAYAPIIPNPAWRLAWALGTLKNSTDKILIEGFYDDVEAPSPDEIAYLKAIPYEEDEEKQELGLKNYLHNLSGLDLLKALLYQPTCTINGFLAGYTGVGSKTVLPNTAMAKLDFRLVPNQMPNDILDKLINHLKNHQFEDIQVIDHGSTEPVKTPVTDRFAQLVIDTAGQVYGKNPVVYPTSAGSGPMHLFRNWLGYPIASIGCSHAESRAHAPNENITVDGFVKATKLVTALIHAMGSF